MIWCGDSIINIKLSKPCLYYRYAYEKIVHIASRWSYNCSIINRKGTKLRGQLTFDYVYFVHVSIFV